MEAPWLPAAPRGGATAGAPPQGDWEALHPDVLHMVFLKLNCQDLVAASGVCVAWRSTAVRVRGAACPPATGCICALLACMRLHQRALHGVRS